MLLMNMVFKRFAVMMLIQTPRHSNITKNKKKGTERVLGVSNNIFSSKTFIKLVLLLSGLLQAQD